jgi:hypothetical protein
MHGVSFVRDSTFSSWKVFWKVFCGHGTCGDSFAGSPVSPLAVVPSIKCPRNVGSGFVKFPAPMAPHWRRFEPAPVTTPESVFSVSSHRVFLSVQPGDSTVGSGSSRGFPGRFSNGRVVGFFASPLATGIDAVCMPRNFVETETALGFRKIYKNAAVIVLTDSPGVTWNGIIRSPAPKLSLVRYNEGGILREKRVSNAKLVPAKAEPKADLSPED